MLPLSGFRTQEVTRITGGGGYSAVTMTLVTVGRHFPPETVRNLRDEPAKSADNGVQSGRDASEADLSPVEPISCVASIETFRTFGLARIAEDFNMPRPAFGTRFGFRTALVFGLLAGLCATATAQGFRGGGDRGGGFGGGVTPSPEDSFRRLDRNQNGQIDPDELGFMRDIFSRAGMDVSRPISQQAFVQGSQQLRQQFEQARTSGESLQMRRPEGGGGPPSGGGMTLSFSRPESDRGDGRRSEESGRDSGRGERREDRESANSSKSSKKSAKPKARVTKDLPTDYREKDKNGDGQIGLYEWDRKAFAQFFDLDRNGDGLLTADELLAAAKKSSTSSASVATSSSSTTVALSSSPQSPSTTEFSKPNAAAAPTPTSPAPPAEMTAGMKVFVGLDTNRDGTLTDEEWQRSRTARGKFEKAGIAVSFPIQQAQFVEMYKQVEAQ